MSLGNQYGEGRKCIKVGELKSKDIGGKRKKSWHESGNCKNLFFKSEGSTKALQWPTTWSNLNWKSFLSVLASFCFVLLLCFLLLFLSCSTSLRALCSLHILPLICRYCVIVQILLWPTKVNGKKIRKDLASAFRRCLCAVRAHCLIKEILYGIQPR